MLRGRVASLFAQGYAPRFDPQTQGVLPQALRALFSGGAAQVPPVPLGTGNQKPQPLSSTTYLRGEKFA